MKNKRMLPVVIVDLIAILVCIAANVYVALKGELTVLQTVNMWVNVAALLSALVYLMMGYKKNAAVFYKIFASVFALSQFVAVLSVAKYREDYTGISCYTVLFALLLMLALAEDLGKKKTFITCGVILAVGVLLLALTYFATPQASETGTWFMELVLSFSVIVMSAVMWLMAVAKYLDKEARKGYEE